MTTRTIDTCSLCDAWSSLRQGRCYQCRAVADLDRFPRDRLLTVPISMLASGLRLQVRVLASAGFGAARIAALLCADEADVRRVLDT